MRSRLEDGGNRGSFCTIGRHQTPIDIVHTIPNKFLIPDTQRTMGNKHNMQNNENCTPKIPKLDDDDIRIDEANSLFEPENRCNQQNNHTPNGLNNAPHPYLSLVSTNPLHPINYVHENTNSNTIDPLQLSDNLDNVNQDSDSDSTSSSFSDNVQFVPREYDFNKAFCLKTSDRILDDIRSDPLFLLRNEEGILSQHTTDYSHLLSNLAKPNNKYKPVFWKTSSEELGSYEMVNIDHNTNLASFSGLLVPETSTKELLNSKVFHYVLRIKYFNDAINVKNSFYGFADDDLFEDDKTWIQSSDILEDSGLIPDQAVDILTKSLPQLLDSANFVSKETKMVVRVEIYPAVFSQEELERFDITEIQTRIATYNSQFPSGNVFGNINLTPYDCFIKLRSVLTGAIKHSNDETIKSIDIESTKLSVFMDISFLLDKFFFCFTEVNGHGAIMPVKLADLGENGYVYKSFIKRAIVEIVYYISITSTKKEEASNLLCNSLDSVFELFKEFDTNEKKKHWNTWTDQYYSEAFITLSVCPYYRDDLIQHIYDEMASFDPDNIPLYFDALTYCATSRYSDSLQYTVAVAKGQGLVGFGELKNNFAKLGFDVPNCKSMNLITDEQILEAYRNQIIVASSIQEKTSFRENLQTIANSRSSASLSSYLNTEPFFDVTDAYALFEAEPMIDDSFLISYYDFKVSDTSASDGPNVARALYSIALSRRSVILMNYIDNNLPQFSVTNLSVADAYKYIGCLETADDLNIIRIFQERVNKDTYADFKTLWKSLKILCQLRHSKLIEGYLSSGIVNSTFLETDQSPAGLNNIGNTCYLNSLLQYYFVIEPLRDYILNFNEVFSPEAFQSDERYQNRRIGGRTVNLKETERSYQFMYQLRDLYSHLIHDNDRDVTPTKELAYLAFSPISFEVDFEEENEINPEEETDTKIEEDENALVDLDEASKENKPMETNVVDLTSDHDDTPILEEEAKSDDNDTELTDGEGPEPKLEIKKKSAAVCKISPDQFESAFEIGSQQDVTECISNVLIQIESAMKPEKFEENNEQVDMVKELFYGKTKQRLVPVDATTNDEIPNAKIRTKVESFLNLIVNIGDHPKDIYDALDTFFTEDLMVLEDGPVKRSLTITELPKILQIQIQRVQFDRIQLRPVKSNDPIPFEEKLYMDRYLETDDEVIINKRKEIFQWRRRVEELSKIKADLTSTSNHGMTTKDVLKTTRDYLKSDAVQLLQVTTDMNTLEVLDTEIERLEKQMVSTNDELELLQRKINDQFAGFNKVGYSIFAIFIHRGQASYGHYFIYIRDPKANVYRKYNDEIVSEVPVEEIFNFAEGNTATPYYLTFVKDELLDKITPLHRDILVQDTLQELDGIAVADENDVTGGKCTKPNVYDLTMDVD